MNCMLMAIMALALLGGCTGFSVYNDITPKEDFFNYSLLFCSRDDCTGRIASELAGAKISVQCAFYRADSTVLGNIPVAAEIVVDDKAKVGNYSGISIKKAESRGIMHSKYCIIDNTKVITGSFNPVAGAAKDYNNLIIINSATLAGFYNENFHSLSNHNAQQPKKKKAVLLNETLVEVYFCPDDKCASIVRSKLRQASSSIIFAAYSFTHPEIANELILKSAASVTVAGVMEKSGTGSQYSKYSSMSQNRVGIRLESSKRLMHHKFFIIDNETVITGSFNPTKNADERNDENIIIIRNREVALEYYSEFAGIFGAE